MTDVNETVSGYETVTLPHYTDHVLAERAKSAVRDFRHSGYVLAPPAKRVDVVETFLAAFLAREAERSGLEFNLFRLSERQAVFYGWRTGGKHAIRYDALNQFQKVRALLLLAEAVPAPEWGKKKK